MDINLLKTLSKELIEITEEMQKRAENHALTDAEFLEFVKKVSKKNALISKEIGVSTKNWL